MSTLAKTESSDRAAAPVKDARLGVLEAAAHCFMEQGFSATSIDDVAVRLSATKGMIYHHFRSKTDLFFEVYRRGMSINSRALDAAEVAGDTALERLTRMAFAHARVLMAEQAYQRVLGQGVQLHQQGSTTATQRTVLRELIAERNAYEQRFRLAIEEALDEDQKAVNGLSLKTKSFLAVLNSTVYWYTPRAEDTGAEQAAIAADLVDYAMRGLGLSPAIRVLESTSAPSGANHSTEKEIAR